MKIFIALFVALVVTTFADARTLKFEQAFGVVRCDDGQTICPRLHFCCQQDFGVYGCCLVRQNGDGINSEDKVRKAVDTVIQSRIKKFGVKDQCPDGSSCPGSDTCCPSSSGGYGCCPQPDATCCSDGQHCCPSGYSCSGSFCIKSGDIVTRTDYTSLQSRIKKFGVKDQCPDGSSCPGSDTCCPSSSGGYGCCPQPDATCCSDGQHCCPSGYSCSGSFCIKSRDIVTRTDHTSLQSRIKKFGVKDQCPDGSSCPGSDTCCPSRSGGYGCCPQPDATCCSDGQHCCPSGYSCSGSFCIKSGDIVTRTDYTSLQSKIKKFGVKDQCPDGSSCPGSDTCCPSSSGGYGCCPQPDATCCSDGQHCCPSGYSCSGSFCIKSGDIVTNTDYTSLQSKIKKFGVKDQCPDGSSCPGSDTCCPSSSGGYGCCPQPDATCCSDGQHCCPSGYSCSGSFCIKSGDNVTNTGYTPFQSKIKKVGVKDTCPDGSSCPGSDTCCPSSSGGFGCCPQPDATCCSDGQHCCPSGYSCSGSFCIKSGDNVTNTSVQSRLKKFGVKDQCPDGSSCPGRDTCCPSNSGGYGCCPQPDATCCSDGQHCCPSGYSCSGSFCTKSEDIVKKTDYIIVQSRSKRVGVTDQCPDGSSCPGSDTCCPSSSGGYGCCPQPDATCCSDGQHCCPSGYSCSGSFCIKSGDFVTKTDNTSVQSRIKKFGLKDQCQDGSSCPGSDTCCPSSSGGYGCCPQPNATCCGDGKHCCPSGYMCSGSFCIKSGDNVTKTNDTSVQSRIKKCGVKDQCPDGSSCPGSDTCCPSSGGGYGCCPQPDATCCSDGQHCCPSGYSCSGSFCIKN